MLQSKFLFLVRPPPNLFTLANIANLIWVFVIFFCSSLFFLGSYLLLLLVATASRQKTYRQGFCFVNSNRDRKLMQKRVERLVIIPDEFPRALVFMYPPPPLSISPVHFEDVFENGTFKRQPRCVTSPVVGPTHYNNITSGTVGY